MRNIRALKTIALASAIVPVLTGCGALAGIPRWRPFPFEGALKLEYEIDPGQEPEAEPALAVTAPEPIREEYTVFIEDIGYKPGLYEPPKGAYLGAYILSDPGIGYDMSLFDSATGKSHAMYSYYMSAEGEFPVTWVLSCLAKNKTPNIVVKATKFDIDDAELARLARDIGGFHVPMFVQLAPVDSRFDADSYKDFFRRAHDVFAEHASNAALVWTVKAEDAFDCMKYYPGDGYADWVGLSLYQTLTGDGEYDPALMSAFEHFYYSFQKTKPIMLSEYAVSHLSSLDSVYRASLAANRISGMYGEIARAFPRVKAVTYMDVNGFVAASSRKVRDDFALLEQPEVLSAYSAAIGGAGYLSEIYGRGEGGHSPQLMRSPFSAYRSGREIFIARGTVEQDMNLSGLSSISVAETTEGRDYFTISQLRAAGAGRIEADGERRTVTVKR